VTADPAGEPFDVFDEILDPPPAPADVTEAEDGPRYADVHAFVAEHLAEAWGRALRDPDNAFRWCTHWHEHSAARERLTALWQAWETARVEGGTALLRWWREADAVRAALTTPGQSPFDSCRPGRHRLPPPLPTAATAGDLAGQLAS
jgi:hypothetical protein